MAKSRSKVFELPPELRAQLDALLRQPNMTLDKVMAHLRQLAGDEADIPSRSAVHRYAQQIESISERVNRAQQIADRIMETAGPQIADGKGLQVLVQGFYSLAFDLLANKPEGEAFDPENLQFLAKAISSVASAQKTDADRALKIEQAALKRAAEKVDAITRSAGLSPDLVASIRANILGTA